MIYVDAQRTQLQVFYVLRPAIILCLRAALFKAHLQTKSVSCLSYLHTVARHLLPQLVAFCSSSKLGVFACLSHRLSLIGVTSYPMESLINLPPLVSMKSLVHLDQFCPHTVCGQPGPGEHFTVPFWTSFPLISWRGIKMFKV